MSPTLPVDIRNVGADCHSMLEAALAYQRAGWPIFPCRRTDKRPLTENGYKDATGDTAGIRRWWTDWPRALIAVPTGRGFAVLDIDVRPDRDGFKTLAALGVARLPATPTVRTRSGGYHLYLTQPEPPIGITAGDRGRGIGAGLDWRGLGGYVVVPAPGSGYGWLPGTVDLPLAPVPPPLIPKPPPLTAEAGAAREADALSPYGEAAIRSACGRILNARNGAQYATLNGEAYSLGRLAAAGGVPAGVALACLTAAAEGVPSFDRRRPWRDGEAARVVGRAFADGRGKPRPDPADAERAAWKAWQEAMAAGETEGV